MQAIKSTGLRGSTAGKTCRATSSARLRNTILRHLSFPQHLFQEKNIMKAKLSEDWLSVIIAFALIALALVGLISPAWMKF